MSYKRTYSAEATEMWLEWLSKIKRIFLSFEELTYFWKCWSHFTNVSLSIHPLEVTSPSDPEGSPFLKLSTILFGANRKTGSKKFPLGFIVHTAVMVLPLAALVIFPTCFWPLLVIALAGFLYCRNASLVHIEYSFTTCNISCSLNACLRKSNKRLACAWFKTVDLL